MLNFCVLSKLSEIEILAAPLNGFFSVSGFFAFPVLPPGSFAYWLVRPLADSPMHAPWTNITFLTIFIFILTFKRAKDHL